MKVLSIIFFFFFSICLIVSIALSDECRSDEYELYTGFMIFFSLLFMAVGALSTIHAFKKN